ncbi:Methyltransferase domain-containing protein [Salinimicrobium sediminis]|uniref:Methyltransferase domain-containing protein n=1 Tax=Salinimicrobium sediminis TaxID=1343891 RepID=A0A285WZP6_9FLAO|nr:class I SAM-dependent methyltransferase [Salinimicrobium sediminis]SOC78565.1 Methyltransferase domain-containing protein [Salinimicrobium sediminis]
MKQNIDEVLKANDRQKEFYNSTREAKKSLPTRLWFSLRNKFLDPFRRTFNIKSRVYEQHKVWLGDLSDKKILDLGCLRGNALSLYMAKNAKEYIGIDLSDRAIEDLNKKLRKADCPRAKAIAVDFLSSDFKEKDFDIIYAYGVLHHFENLEILMERIKQKLKIGGTVISYDPLDTSAPVKVLRKLYRPFQSDKDWEWPFTKKTMKEFERHFKIEEVRGILGKSKYGLLINLLPLKAAYKEKTIKKLIENDWNAQDPEQVYHCMQVTMLFRNT